MKLDESQKRKEPRAESCDSSTLRSQRKGNQGDWPRSTTNGECAVLEDKIRRSFQSTLWVQLKAQAKDLSTNDQQVHKAGLASLVTGKYKSKQQKRQERWDGGYNECCSSRAVPSAHSRQLTAARTPAQGMEPFSSLHGHSCSHAHTSSHTITDKGTLKT